MASEPEVVEAPDVWAELDAQMQSDAPTPEGYTIERGGKHDGGDTSPAAQGKRAAKHARRVKGLRDIQAMQQAMLDVEIAELEAALGDVKHRHRMTEEWFLARSQFDRQTLREWYETSPLFEGPKQKSHPLAYGLTIGSRTVPARTTVEIVDPDGLRGLLPAECFGLKKGEANKHLDARDGRAVVKESGEVLPETVAVAVTSAERETFYIAHEAEKTKVDLGGEARGSDDSAADSGGDTGDSRLEQGDPFAGM